MGLAVQESTGTVEHTVVRNTQVSTRLRGFGIAAAVPPGSTTPASFHISECLVSHNAGINIVGDGAAITVERTLITDPISVAYGEGKLSRGIGIQVDEAAEGLPGSLTMTGSLVTRALGSGVYATGCELNIANSAITNTLLFGDEPSRSIEVDNSDIGTRRGKLVLVDSVIEKANDSAIFDFSSDLTIQRSVLLGSFDPTAALPNLGLYFDDEDDSTQPNLLIEDTSFIGSSDAQASSSQLAAPSLARASSMAHKARARSSLTVF
ncbi:MAG: hypothetical protein U0165_13610 [Polyangiaceae bacterium]